MNCFYHPSTPAVALCKFCQKGLCQACAVDLDSGMSCPNHTAEVQRLEEAFTASQRTNLGAGKLYTLFAAVFAFFGLAMLTGGLFLGPIGYVMIFTGLVCIIFAGLYLLWGQRYRKPQMKKEGVRK